MWPSRSARGGSVLVTGSAGTGKSSISAKFAETARRRRERAGGQPARRVLAHGYVTAACAMLEFNGERNRMIYVLKSRGMAHSNQVREFVLSDAGIDLRAVYHGGNRVLTGPTRAAQEAQERAARRRGRGDGDDFCHRAGDLAKQDHAAKRRRHRGLARRRQKRQQSKERKPMKKEQPAKFELRLYVAGETAKSRAALAKP